MSDSGNHDPLANLDQASRMLAEAQDLDEIKLVRNMAETARCHFKAVQMGLDAQNKAAELRLQAERKAGQFLATLNLRGGDHRSKGQRASLKVKLDDLGITRDQSKRWQRIASISEQDFRQYIESSNRTGCEITSADLLRIAKNNKAEAKQTSQGKGRGRNKQRSGRGPFAVSNAVAPRHQTEPADLPRESRDLIVEIRDHWVVLAGVLRALPEGEELTLADKRFLERALPEIDELIDLLSRQ